MRDLLANLTLHKNNDTKTTYKIAYSNKHKCYFLEDNTTRIASIELNFEQYMKVKSEDYSFLSELATPFDPKTHVVDCWTEDCKVDNERYIGYIDYLNPETINELPYGTFYVSYVANRLAFTPYKSEVKPPDTIIKNKNLKEIVLEFFENPRVGRKNKAGILLYGPPGNGKTTEISELYGLAESMGIRIFITSKQVYMENMVEARNLLEKDKAIFVFEEMTERIARTGMADVLTFLDGENSWNNSITIGTTNYPEEFPANLVDRPGRFEIFIEYGNPTASEIKQLGEKFGFTEEESGVLAGKNLSFDYVSFIMSLAKKNNVTILEAKEKEEEKRKRLSSTFKGKIGF